MALAPEDRPSISDIIQTFSNNQPIVANEPKLSVSEINTVIETPVVTENIQPIKEKKRNRKPVFAFIIFILIFSITGVIFLRNYFNEPNTLSVKEKITPVIEKKQTDGSNVSELTLNENDSILEEAIVEVDTSTVIDTATSKPKKYAYKKRSLIPFRNEAGLYGYMGYKKKIIIEPAFEDVFEFSGHIAAVKSKNLWGYIDTTGNWIIKPQFIKAETFKNGLATVQKDGINFTINTEGTCVTGCSSISQQSF
jgi:hypothetical protein